MNFSGSKVELDASCDNLQLETIIPNKIKRRRMNSVVFINVFIGTFYSGT